MSAEIDTPWGVFYVTVPRWAWNLVKSIIKCCVMSGPRSVIPMLVFDQLVEPILESFELHQRKVLDGKTRRQHSLKGMVFNKLSQYLMKCN